MQNADLHQRIKLRAYLLWEQEGRPEGRAEEHWLRAEAEVAGVNTGGEAPTGTPGTGEHICPACAGTGRLVGTDVRHAAAPAASSTFPNHDLRDHSVARRHA